MNAGNLGGIVGCVVGVAGGLIGTYFSIKHTKGPRERNFMIRAAIVCWSIVCSLLAVMLLFPQLRFWIWVPYGLLLILGINYGNRKQMAIRREEHDIA